jgi:polyhydroxyalkanoate synthesis regulator phasin
MQQAELDTSVWAELAERLGTHRADLEMRLEEGVRRALEQWMAPKQDELLALRERADRLEARLSALQDEAE